MWADNRQPGGIRFAVGCVTCETHPTEMVFEFLMRDVRGISEHGASAYIFRRRNSFPGRFRPAGSGGFGRLSIRGRKRHGGQRICSRMLWHYPLGVSAVPQEISIHIFG